jgi:tetratricopeptide (TPR) repeat protein
MGVSYFKIKKYKSALYYLDLANNSSDPEILYYLGASYYELQNYSKAIRVFKKSLIINPKNEYTIYALGQTYIESDNKRDSKRQLKTLMNLNSELFELLKVSFDAKFSN